MDISELIQTVSSYSDSSEISELLETAYEIASDAHQGFTRISGEAFINHPLAVATILAEWHAPAPIVAVGLLHDILSPEYSYRRNVDDLRSVLQPDVCRLLDSVVGLNQLIRDIEREVEGKLKEEKDAINIQQDLNNVLQQGWEVTLVKIADRVHNLRTISSLSRYYQERTALIGFKLLAPLADRLSMGSVKRLLEDKYFEIHDAAHYKILKQSREKIDLQQDIESLLEEFRQVFGKLPLKIEAIWQPSSLYAIYRQQVEKNKRSGKPVDIIELPLKVMDAGTFILLTEQEEDCYFILGLLHKRYPPVERQFRDFIGGPKENGYQSLHTQVKHSNGKVLNVIIRTRGMNLFAERGITIHWWNVPSTFFPQLPKENKPSVIEKPSENKTAQEIQVLTPQGAIMNLPQGATVLDFAYHIHTDIGHQCVGALVNGELAELQRPLQTGDRVEILSDISFAGPTFDWLKYVKTLQATNRIRQWLAQYRHDDMLVHGRMLLDRELQQLGLDSTDAYVLQLLSKVASRDKLSGIEDLFVAIGVGRYNVDKLVGRLKSMRLKVVGSQGYIEPILDVKVLSPNYEQLPRVFARCCEPVPYDDIVGYMRRDGILTVHKRSCPQVNDLCMNEPDKFVQIKWSSAPEVPDYVIFVDALNRPGLARDISTTITLLGLDMQSFSANRRPDGVTAEVRINIDRTTLKQRNRILKALEEKDYVNSVEVIYSPFLSAPTPQLVTSSSSYQANPYGPTLAVGSRFYGREDQCERICSLLRDRAQNHAILLCGQKRIGKTSLVLRLQQLAGDDFYPVYIDMQGLRDSNTTQFLSRFMSSTAAMLQSKLPEVSQEISAPHLNRLRKDPLSYYDAFMDRIEKIPFSSSLVMILDEFQCLFTLREQEVSLGAIFDRLRSRSLHGKGIHFVLSGSGLTSQLSDQYNLASLFSITYNEPLPCLQEKAARKLIKDGLTKAGNISDMAIDLLHTFTSGHPYYLQLLCSKLYEQAHENRTLITHQFVRENIQEWIVQTSSHRFQHFWEGYDAKSAIMNKLVLSAIAQLGSHAYGAEYQSLAAALSSVLTEHSLVEALSNLKEMGVIKQNQLNYQIEVYLFVKWLQYHCPLKLVLQEAHSL
jgi:guanosine-3',5'-bis(diphosphate) 3'-pyrophosphohydrolase